MYFLSFYFHVTKKSAVLLLHQCGLCSVFLYLLLKYFSYQLLLILLLFFGKSNAQNIISSFQALYVNPLDSYNIHWPIRRGQLNLHTGPGGSLTAVLADLEVIWSHAIQKYLEIPLKDLKVSCEWHIYVVGAVPTSLSVTVKGKQLAVIGGLLLMLLLINTFFLLVSRVPKTSSGVLSKSFKTKAVDRTSNKDV